MSAEVSGVVCPLCRASAPVDAKAGDVCPADGRAWVPADVVERHGRDKLLGRTLGEGERYALVGVLGAGGMGAVYRAVDRQSGDAVAIKAAHIDPRRSATARTLLMRLRREARVLSRLNHPRIVRVRGVGTIESEDLHYIVMDLAPGVPLGQLLRQRGRLETPLALSIADQVLAALGAAHELGFVHRDVKPQNVLVALSEVEGAAQVECTLIDFGIVKSVRHTDVPNGDEERTRPGATIGTPTYMAPEQLSAGEIGPPTDVYAVGVLLYRMLAGEAPFVGTSAEVVAGHLRDPAPPLPVTLDVPDAVRHAVSVALRKRSEDRFADAGEMKGALKGQWSPSRTAPQLKVDAAVSEASVSDQQWAEDLLVGGMSDALASASSLNEAAETDDLPDWARPRPKRGRPALWLGGAAAILGAWLMWPGSSQEDGDAAPKPESTGGGSRDDPETPATVSTPFTDAPAVPVSEAAQAPLPSAAVEVSEAPRPVRARPPAARNVAPRPSPPKPNEVLVPILPMDVPP